MACIEQKTDFNFLNWHKVVGSYTLSELQANGIPNVCDNINVDEGWRISTSVFLQEFSVATQDNVPENIFFKPDGLKMYINGQQNGKIYEFNLGTAWSVITATFLQDFSISPVTNPYGVFFKSDGLKLYIIGVSAGVRKISEFDLSVAWDITTITLNQELSVGATDNGAFGLFFKSNGLKLYFGGRSNDKIYEFDLSVAWDISTAVLFQDFSIVSEQGAVSEIFFKPDGTSFYIVGVTPANVTSYNMSTAWSVSTASFDENFSVSTQDTAPFGLFFKPNGFKMYVLGVAGDKVYEYDLTS